MEFVSDPPIATKIRKMKRRIHWQDPLVVARNIDQTKFILDDGHQHEPDFSFMVIGDSGAGVHRPVRPQRQIAEQMLQHFDDCRFVLHTGDVIYLVGSSEYYLDNFINPYREFLLGGEHPERLDYTNMTFAKPILPVPGNHDYYDLPLVYGVLSQLTLPIRRLLRSKINWDIAWHGSFQGKAYAEAFLDYTKALANAELAQHLDHHYTHLTDSGRCLRYQPGRFTRLPNRYYTFRYGGIDFFALDSNTFNAPAPLPETEVGMAARRALEARRLELEQQKENLLDQAAKLEPDHPDESEQLDDLRTKIEQLDEIIFDIDKQLHSRQNPELDLEQLNWLRDQLIESWHSQEVRGRIIYFHHPPYVTEATKWEQAQTLAVRHNLRLVLDAVAEKVGDLAADRPLVDLMLNGHAHCLEHLITGDTGHGDSHINWLVCGGSGYSLRRQRKEGTDLVEQVEQEKRLVARSKLFVGRSGRGSKKHRPYSFLRIDVLAGNPPRYRIRPSVSELYQHQWSERELEPWLI